MSTSKRVLIDVDCVLADFIADCVKLIDVSTGEKHDKNLVNDAWNVAVELGRPEFTSIIDEFIRNRITTTAVDYTIASKDTCLGFAASMVVADGAKYFIKRLSHFADVTIVTSPLYENITWCSDRVFWLKQHFGIQQEQIVFAKDKSIIRGDFLIDDDPKHVILWAKKNPNAKAFLWSGCMPNRQVDMSSYPTNVEHYKEWDDVLYDIKITTFY